MLETSYTANPVPVADAALAGWAFGDSNAIEWQPIGERIALKRWDMPMARSSPCSNLTPAMRVAHTAMSNPKFTFVMEGSIVSNGVLMKVGQCYAVGSGTDHTEFRSEEGGVILSVFKAPG